MRAKRCVFKADKDYRGNLTTRAPQATYQFPLRKATGPQVNDIHGPGVSSSIASVLYLSLHQGSSAASNHISSTIRFATSIQLQTRVQNLLCWVALTIIIVLISIASAMSCCDWLRCQFLSVHDMLNWGHNINLIQSELRAEGHKGEATSEYDLLITI
ncbi:hypothetical protein M5K25_013240 [Dendrobium thyrsiflorum]|uniref:Uncharacterized protein n=1 Tax=Dendrobium thyrsiflorum TaxID=117978 RepID=A0ABD0USG4_DENTH